MSSLPPYQWVGVTAENTTSFIAGISSKHTIILGLPQWLSDKESTCDAEDTGDLGSIPGEDPLEEGMTTHSSILAWRIPWTEEPGGLQSIGSQGVGHD